MSEEKTVPETKDEPEVIQEESKIKTFFKKCGDGLVKGIHWCAENPGAIVPVLIGGFSAISGIVTLFSGNDKLEHCLSEDDRTGEMLATKHPLTNEQVLKLGDMMDEGMSKGEALQAMGLLRDEKKRKF